MKLSTSLFLLVLLCMAAFLGATILFVNYEKRVHNQATKELATVIADQRIAQINASISEQHFQLLEIHTSTNIDPNGVIKQHSLKQTAGGENPIGENLDNATKSIIDNVATLNTDNGYFFQDRVGMLYFATYTVNRHLTDPRFNSIIKHQPGVETVPNLPRNARSGLSSSVITIVTRLQEHLTAQQNNNNIGQDAIMVNQRGKALVGGRGSIFTAFPGLSREDLFEAQIYEASDTHWLALLPVDNVADQIEPLWAVPIQLPDRKAPNILLFVFFALVNFAIVAVIMKAAIDNGFWRINSVIRSLEKLSVKTDTVPEITKGKDEAGRIATSIYALQEKLFESERNKNQYLLQQTRLIERVFQEFGKWMSALDNAGRVSLLNTLEDKKYEVKKEMQLGRLQVMARSQKMHAEEMTTENKDFFERWNPKRKKHQRGIKAFIKRRRQKRRGLPTDELHLTHQSMKNIKSQGYDARDNVKQQFQRNRMLTTSDVRLPEGIPVFGGWYLLKMDFSSEKANAFGGLLMIDSITNNEFLSTSTMPSAIPSTMQGGAGDTIGDNFLYRLILASLEDIGEQIRYQQNKQLNRPTVIAGTFVNKVRSSVAHMRAARHDSFSARLVRRRTGSQHAFDIADSFQLKTDAHVVMLGHARGDEVYCGTAMLSTSVLLRQFATSIETLQQGIGELSNMLRLISAKQESMSLAILLITNDSSIIETLTIGNCEIDIYSSAGERQNQKYIGGKHAALGHNSVETYEFDEFALPHDFEFALRSQPAVTNASEDYDPTMDYTDIRIRLRSDD